MMGEGRIPGPAGVWPAGEAGRLGGWMGNLIGSERLWLRQLEASEARALLQGKADPERPWMAGYPMQGTLIAVEAFVRAIDNGADPGAYGVYQVVRSGDDMVVGDIGFHGPPDQRGSVPSCRSSQSIVSRVRCCPRHPCTSRRSRNRSFQP